MNISLEEVKKTYYMQIEGKEFPPIYTYETYDIETEEYTGFKLIKSAEELYQESLISKPKEPNKMEVLEKQLNQQESAIGLLATQIAKNTLLQNGGMK